jgi:hypothetical protein
VLAFHLSTIFADVDPRAEIRIEEWSRGAIDIALTREKVAVEYDGKFFHSDNVNGGRDDRKALALRTAGWELIRVREGELELSNFDIRSHGVHWKSRLAVWRLTCEIAESIIVNILRPRCTADAPLLEARYPHILESDVDYRAIYAANLERAERDPYYSEYERQRNVTAMCPFDFWNYTVHDELYDRRQRLAVIERRFAAYRALNGNVAANEDAYTFIDESCQRRAAIDEASKSTVTSSSSSSSSAMTD